MTAKQPEVTEAELHAYVDGCLAADRVPAIESYLETKPDAAQEVAHWRRQNAAIRALYEHVSEEALPERLRPVNIAAKRHRHHMPAWLALAASMALFSLGGLSGWYGHELAKGTPSTEPATSAWAQQAITSHALYAIEVRHPVEIAAQEQNHLVAWLSKRLERPVKAPDLSARGFQLIGGRLLPSTAGPAAQFMYENGRGERLTLFATRNRSNQLAAFHFIRLAPYNAFYWLETDLSWALVGSISRDELRSLATDVYDQLT